MEKHEKERYEEIISLKDHEISSLRDQLNKYEAAANGANDGLWDWDFKSDRAFVSKPWKTMLGMPEEQEIRQDGIVSWKELLHPEDKNSAVSSFEKYVTGRQNNYHEVFRLKHTNGSYRWILSKAKVIRDNSGKAVRISGSHTDITDQKKAADALRKSEEKYRNLFQNSLVAMLRSHADTGQIIEANDKFWELLGIDRQENKLTHFDFFYDSKDKCRVLELLRKNKSLDNFELKVESASGEILWVSLSGVFYEDENIIECVLKDVTQTKHNLLELQKVNFELDSFVYHASHDLRSPLRSVLGLIDLYRMEDSPRVKKQCIEKIESSIKRLDDLVIELLSISRNDRVNDTHVLVNLMVEINSSIASYYNATDTKGLEVITNVNQAIPFYSDLTRIRIILNNLISNAIKYRSFHKEHSYIRVEAHCESDFVTIKVQDNGDGIEESKLPHIFDMFYRATEKSEGSGLGLYIVKKVADKLGAKITVESVELEGTTFIVKIPNIKP